MSIPSEVPFQTALSSHYCCQLRVSPAALTPAVGVMQVCASSHAHSEMVTRMIQRRLRLLLAEPNPGEVAGLLRSLFIGNERGLEITTVSTIATLLPTIKVTDPEIILLDLSLNLREPLDAIHLVHRTAPGIPLVVVADPASEGTSDAHACGGRAGLRAERRD